MRILSVQKGADTAGQAIRMKEAFERHAPDWSFRAMTQPGAGDYISYPYDLKWSNKTVKQMWGDIDVLHVHNNFNTLHWMERRWPGMAHKPTVVHHHGTQFRQNRQLLLDEQHARRAIGITSTLDLYLLAPVEMEWLPAPYDVDWLASLRQPSGDKLRIAHAPTNREIKSTDHFLEATKQLISEGEPIEVDLIEHTTWTECLRRKAKADIFFDQVILGFGCNSLEAWGMGIPVISGVDSKRAAEIGHDIPDTVPQEMERRFGKLPYYPADESTIYNAIKALVTDDNLRAEYTERGKAHVRRFHDYPVVVSQLQDIYRRAVECFDPASTVAA
jgi:hypothetical protein